MADFWRDLTGTDAYSVVVVPPTVTLGYNIGAYFGSPDMHQGGNRDPYWPNATYMRSSLGVYKYYIELLAQQYDGVWVADTNKPLHDWHADLTQSLYIDGALVSRGSGSTTTNYAPSIPTKTLKLYNYAPDGPYYYFSAQIILSGYTNETPAPGSIDIELKDAGGSTLYHSTISITRGGLVSSGIWYTTCNVVNLTNSLFINSCPGEYAGTGITITP